MVFYGHSYTGPVTVLTLGGLMCPSHQQKFQN